MSDQPTVEREGMLRERFADEAHQAWSGWMELLFDKCESNDMGEAILPAWAVNRRMRQSTTSYADLPEDEKESDRTEADRYLKHLTGSDKRIAELEALITELRPRHYYCEADSYYSCPCAEDSYSAPDDECDCSAVAVNAKIDLVLGT